MSLYKILLKSFFIVLVAFCFPSTFAQNHSEPLEIRQLKIKLNPSDYQGMPILKVVNPNGSNGHAPSENHQTTLQLTTDTPAPGNFTGATILSGGWRTEQITKGTTQGTPPQSNGGVVLAGRPDDTLVTATTMLQPKDASGNVKMKWASIGAPLVSRQVSFLLGNKITPPRVNEFGLPLDVNPETYWRAKPFELYDAISASVVSPGTDYVINDIVTIVASNKVKGSESAKFVVTKVGSNGAVISVKAVYGGSYLGEISDVVTTQKDTGSGTGLMLKVNAGFSKFYWSPHANALFATQSGVTPVTWIRIKPVTSAEKQAGVKSGVEYHDSSSGKTHFALLEKTYVVSGAASQKTKTIYWTEKQSNGPLVQIPNAQVNAVNIVYNSNFPERVTAEVNVIGQTSIVGDPSQVLQETRTLWFEYGALHAYNTEGRVFMEYLGAIKGNGSDRVHLGFEIVDVRREAKPKHLIVDLGDSISSGVEENKELDLLPQPVFKTNIGKRHLHDFTGMDGVRRLYAIRETENLNDVLVYWMEKGVQSIRWPSVYCRYKLQWPEEASKYSHYARASESRADAMRSAVQLPSENNPILDYQSNEELKLAAITAEQKFYVHLSGIREHRALIRFMGDGDIWFERVFSFRTNDWVDDPDSPGNIILSGSDWFKDTNSEEPSEKPGYFSALATVGRRIDPPAKNNGNGNVSDNDYWGGHIHTAKGTSYNPNAYVDPMEKGFEEANQSAIIPVNAIPNNNKLEVWWFRKSEREGFKPVYWPSVVGTYTIQWPHEADGFKPESTRNAIVLASNDGSGPLNSLQAKGSIYFENNPAKAGYNPNEEHALMIAGQAYALRDDLNIHRSPLPNNSNYSSSPYVLLEFIDEDARPNMRTFQVIREQAELGLTFEYAVEAGTILQAPMPLPFIDKPLVERNQGDPLVSLNERLAEATVTKNTAYSNGFTEITTQNRHYFSNNMLASLQGTTKGTASQWFYLTEVNNTEKTLKGFVSDKRPIKAVYNASNQQANLPHHRRYTLADAATFAVKETLVVIDSANDKNWVGAVSGKNNKTVDVVFKTGTAPNHKEGAELKLAILQQNIAQNRYSNWRVAGEPLPRNIIGTKTGDFYSRFTCQDRKGNLWVYRGPHDDKEDPWFKVQYYYKTQEGFAFPGVLPAPQAGTITPYLRAESISSGVVTGYTPDSTDNDRVKGDADNDKFGDGNSLAVTYRPKWPDDVPVLRTAQTLTKPVFGLPAVRGQTSLEILYQQSQADGDGDEFRESVILHDPTREKVFELRKTGEVLHEIPDSVNTEIYQGKTYFPNLPPHLVKRFFFDPNRGENGALVFKGEFIDEVVGEDYLLPNIAGAKDLASLKGLCPDSDTESKNKWDAAIAEVDSNDNITGGLKAELELFVHNNSSPGKYHALSNPITTTINSAVEVTNDDQAVDSYALTASGPGVGYVTLVAGNGLAFTPTDEPVSLHIIKVVPELHPGEIKVIAADNPLNEKLTMQQVVDFAGKSNKFDFEWRISPPIDGQEPQIYQTASNQLLTDSEWWHVAFPVSADFTSGKVKTGAYFGARAINEVTTQVKAVSKIPYTLALSKNNAQNQLQFNSNPVICKRLTNGAKITVRLQNGTEIEGTVKTVAASLDSFSLEFLNRPDPQDVDSVFESIQYGVPQSIVYSSFKRPKAAAYKELWLSMNINDQLGAEVYIDGSRVLGANLDSGNKATEHPPGSIQNPLRYSWRLPASQLSGGADSASTATKTHRIVVKLYSNALPGAPQDFNLRLHGITVEDLTTDSGAKWKQLDPNKYLDGVRAVIGGEADVQTLSDNYLTMRYKAKTPIEISQKVKNNATTLFVEKLESALKKNTTLYFEGGQFTLDNDASVGAESLTGKYKGNDLVVDSVGSEFHPDSTKWSQWTEPQLAEGWIKRVLAGINPFHQRAKNLFNNRVDTGVSMLTQAGSRWEGDVALNIENINDYGLIEIYETVLNRGKMLSIDAGINYGPANDALLLAAGYINDLYMFLGNEARADAANPTIGIGTTDGELGSIATALFAFKGQVPSLLEEELGLLRGRDDFLQPGVRTAPAYNRFYWNFTRGIDAGEVIYALNYNITEDEDQGFDGLVNAEDAQKMYPQGHGDAYGHYLTSLKGYYQLLVDEDFTWVPRIEAVNVLGKPVQVDYLDERKFAAAAAALARTGNQVVELTWRKDYKSEEGMGWDHFSTTRYNSSKGTTRRWGVDQWASRTGASSYLNWVTGNAMLPEEDPDPEHEGIQKVDRQTVPELLELVTIGEELQVTMDNAEGGLNPLGLDENSIAMDIDPHFLEAGSGTFPVTHFDQLYNRALVAMNNAMAAFDDAKGVTETMRSEENSLSDFQTELDGAELAYKHTLIELYGTPYPDDIGPGKTYPQGYDGPDLFHHAYVDTPGPKDLREQIMGTNNKDKPYEFKIDIQGWDGGKTYTEIWNEYEWNEDIFTLEDDGSTAIQNTENYKNNLKEIKQASDEGYKEYIIYHINHEDGFLQKPDDFKGKRASPGALQSAVSGIFLAQSALREALNNHWGGLKGQLDREIEVFEEKVKLHYDVRRLNHFLLTENSLYEGAVAANDIYDEANKVAIKVTDLSKDLGKEAIPDSLIAGLAMGGDTMAVAKAMIEMQGGVADMTLEAAGFSKEVAFKLLEVAHENIQRWTPFHQIEPKQWNQEVREALYTLDMSSWNVQMSLFDIANKIQELDEAKRQYRALLASGDRIQAEREIFRQRSSAVIQGMRTRDAGFRIFRNEKLERYKTLFDLAARYTYLTAKVYDYETGLLHTDTGKDFLGRIVKSRAIGLMADGEPQFAGSNTGDPGLSSILAEMKGDYEVLRGRLGFNNPDTQGTTLSLRMENHRILPGTAGEQSWKDILHGARRDNLMDDADVVRHCLQIDSGNGLPVPGLVLEFRTTIEDGYNLFGKPLAGGDSQFSPSNFATKIHGVGVGFENYTGMDVISTNGGAVESAEGVSPTSPNAPWLDSLSLSKSPHVYLIPVGQDIMRSPPLGDASVLRSWNVKDVTIPLPFNVGASDFSARSIWQTKDILSEELFAIRKHQAFRAVHWEADDGGTFSDTAPIYAPSKIVNNRLVGRSVWNTKWKLIIPGKTLLNNPEEGLDRFINGVSDIKVHFETYSYSGN